MSITKEQAAKGVKVKIPGPLVKPLGAFSMEEVLQSYGGVFPYPYAVIANNSAGHGGAAVGIRFYSAGDVYFFSLSDLDLYEDLECLNPTAYPLPEQPAAAPVKALLLAVDFDDTIAVNDCYPGIGAEVPGAIAGLHALVAAGHRIQIWTCRHGLALDNARAWLDARNVRYERMNENCPHLIAQWNDTRKMGADLYVDDRNLGGLPAWGEIVNQVNRHARGLSRAAEPPLSRPDPVNPAHYQGKAVFNQMLDQFGKADVAAFCRLNAFKYLSRAGKKAGSPAQDDLRKCQWYITELLAMGGD